MTIKVAGPLLAALIVTTSQAGLFDFFGSSSEEETTTTTKAVSSAATQSESLMSMLTSQLGVTETQASGGAAALLNQAKGSMGGDSFSSLTDSVPGLSTLLGGGSGTLANSLGGGMDVSSAFKALGMDDSMVGKYASVILEYVTPYATSENLGLLKQAWSAFM